MSITVLDPGPLTTVQDAGRVGYAAQGYRSCGAADGYAYRLGNVLVGNDPGAAVLECTLRGAALRFETDTVFALTGAESPAALDSTPVPYYAPLLAKAGSVLQMGAGRLIKDWSIKDEDSNSICISASWKHKKDN